MPRDWLFEFFDRGLFIEKKKTLYKGAVLGRISKYVRRRFAIYGAERGRQCRSVGSRTPKMQKRASVVKYRRLAACSDSCPIDPLTQLLCEVSVLIRF